MFAGVINTGINGRFHPNLTKRALTHVLACWILINLAIHPEWKERIRQECEDLVVRQLGDNTSGAPLHQRLASIPLPAWEDEMPILDAAIRETLRLYVTGTTLRRNVLDDISFGGKVIDKGAFMAYSIADVHLNDNIYPNPMKFDPGRFLNVDKQVSKVVYPYLGWGVGEFLF
jgi:sterol 14-demethylase